MSTVDLFYIVEQLQSTYIIACFGEFLEMGFEVVLGIV